MIFLAHYGIVVTVSIHWTCVKMSLLFVLSLILSPCTHTYVSHTIYDIEMLCFSKPVTDFWLEKFNKCVINIICKPSRNIHLSYMILAYSWRILEGLKKSMRSQIVKINYGVFWICVMFPNRFMNYTIVYN